MGNQMFQYALGRTLALKHGVQLGLDLTDLLDHTPGRGVLVFRNFDLHVFNIQAHVVDRSEIPFLQRRHFRGRLSRYAKSLQCRLSSRGRERGFRFDPDILTLPDGTYLEGYWQSPKYFSDSASMIRADFTLKHPVSEEVRALMAEIRSVESVCINVRRGDFVHNPFHPVLDEKWYQEAVGLVAAKLRAPRLYIFSDDLDWCREHLNFRYPTIIVSHEYAGKTFETYLALMSTCQHFIIPNSSFGWWAAWLSDAPKPLVVAPKRWVGDATRDPTDLIPEDWIRI
jgi:hypothetical protein